MTHNKLKRILSVLLTLVMVISMAPAVTPTAKAAYDAFSAPGWFDGTTVALYHAGDTFPSELQVQSAGNYISYNRSFKAASGANFKESEVLNTSALKSAPGYVSDWSVGGLYDPTGTVLPNYFTENFRNALADNEQSMITDVLTAKNMGDANPADFEIVWYVAKYQYGSYHINGMIREKYKYSVTYDANGSTDAPPQGQIDMSYSQARSYYVQTTGISRNGYEFIGWDTQPDGSGTFFEAGETADLTNLKDENGNTIRAITLYAQWAEQATYTVYWKDYAGNTIHADTGLHNGDTATYESSLPTPTRAPDDNYVYTFNNTWKYENGTVATLPVTVGNDDITLYAQFNSAPRTYTVTWVNQTVIHTDSGIDHNDTVTYDGPAPTRSETEDEGYRFDGWATTETPVSGETIYSSSHAFNVKGDMTLYARFTRVPKYTVNWYNENGATLLATQKALQGTTVTYPNAAPTKAGHTFDGWATTAGNAAVYTPAQAVAVTGNLNLYAHFTINTYTVTWKNWDGSVLETDSNVPYNTTPTYDGSAPTRASTESKTYTFLGWTPSISAVTGNVTYTAAYTEATRAYTVIWNNYDGTELKRAQIDHGVTPSYGATNPTRTETATHTYTFLGWTPTVSAVPGNVNGDGVIIYTAEYQPVPKYFTATVNVLIDPTVTSSGGVTGGTPSSIEALAGSGVKLYLRGVGENPDIIPLTQTGTGKYTASAVAGAYQVVALGGSYADYTLFTDERILLPHSSAEQAADPDTTTADILYFSVTYDFNGGTVDGKSSLVEYHKRGTLVYLSDYAPTRELYTFNHWHLDNNAATLWQTGQCITDNYVGIAQPHVLKAQWIRSSHKVNVELTILHHANPEKGIGINPAAQLGSTPLELQLTYRPTGSSEDYVQTGASYTDASWYTSGTTTEGTATHNGTKYATKTTKINYSASTTGFHTLSSLSEYSSNIRLVDYFLTERTVTASAPDANGDVTYTVKATLQYDPDLFRLNYTVNIDPSVPDELIPTAVDLKLLSYDGTVANQWAPISRHQETTLEARFNGTSRTVSGSYGVPVHQLDDSLFYYRAAVAGFTMNDSEPTEVTASDGAVKLVDYKSDPTGAGATYTYASGAYTAVVEVTNGASNVGGVPAVYGAADPSGGYTQVGSVTVTIYAHPYTITFKPNGGVLNGSTADVVLKNQFRIPVLGGYVPTREGNYLFRNWYDQSNGLAVTGTPLSENITLTAQWIDPLTVHGKIYLSTTYLQDGKVHAIPALDLPKTLTVTLEHTQAISGVTEPIEVKILDINYTTLAASRLGVVEYSFTPVPQDGSTYRIYIDAPNYSETFLNEPESNVDANVTNFSTYDADHAAVDKNGNNSALVHGYLSFAPANFDLTWKVDSSRIGEDSLRPDALGILVQCNNKNDESTDPTGWDVISQQYQGGVYSPLTTVLSADAVTDSFPVWQAHPQNFPYDYAVKVYQWTEGSATKLYDSSTAPFTLTYSPHIAWYDADTGKQVTGQSESLLGITLIPKTYTITYDLNAGGDTVTGLTGAPESHVWSHQTKGIPTTLTRAGYDFLGWSANVSGYSNGTISADTAQNVTLTAQWRKQKMVTFQVEHGTWSDNTTAPITVPVSLDASGKADISALVPTGMKALYGYGNGSWDSGLPANRIVTGDEAATYTFSFERLSVTVTYNADDPASDSPLNGQTTSLYYGNYIRVEPEGGVWNHGSTAYLTSADLKMEANATLANPTRAGYLFAGWALHYANDTIHGGSVVTRRFVAVWLADANGDSIPDQYQKTVTFVVENGKWHDGTTVPKAETVTLRDGSGNPSLSGTASISTFIPTGMTPTPGFLSENAFWAPALPDNGIVSGSGDLTYTYRHYTEVFYTDHDRSMAQSKYAVLPGTVIAIDPNDGGVTESYTATVSGPYSLPDPTRDTYTFKGWKRTEDSFTAQWERNKYTVTWKNDTGVTLETDTDVVHGTVPSYNGSTPVKPHTAQYSYTFVGWTRADDSTVYTTTFPAVTGPVTYTAVYEPSVNAYTVTWVNWDGSVLETDTGVPYGTTPTYNGSTPTRDATAQYTYTFTGWTPGVDSVTGDVTYTAQYNSTLREYTVTWVNWDDSVLETDTNVDYGTTPTYDGPTPTRPDDDLHTYTFLRWTPTEERVTGNVTYKALYNQIQVRFTGTVNIHLNGAAYTGTNAVETLLGSGTKLYLGNGTDYYELSETANGVYSNEKMPNGNYHVYAKGGSYVGYTQICEQILTIENGNRQRNSYFYSVTYDANGGAPDSVEYYHEDHPVTVAEKPTKADHIFLGWKSGSTLYQPDQALTAGIVQEYTLTAQWVEAIDVTLRVNVNKKSPNYPYHVDSDTVVKVIVDLLGRESSLDPWLEVPGRDRLTLTTTNTTHTTSGNWVYYVSNDTVLRNLRSDMQYTVTAEKAHYDVVSVTVQDLLASPLPNKLITVELVYDPDAFDLLLEADASGLPDHVRPDAVIAKVAYWDGDSWELISQHAGDAPGVRINLDTDGKGTGSYTVRKVDALSHTYRYCMVVTGFVFDGALSPVTTATGSQFTDGLYTANVANNDVHWNGSAQSGTLNAVISRRAFNITFVENGGSNISDINGVYSIPALSSHTPVHSSGAEFDGWYTDSGLTTPAVVGTVLSSDVTLYAKWKLNISGTVEAGVTFNGSETIPNVHRIPAVTVLLQHAPAGTSHFTTQQTQTVAISYEGQSLNQFSFPNLSDSGTWRIQVLNHCYTDTYQNENSAQFTAGNNTAVGYATDRVATVNVKLDPNPHRFALHYKVETDNIGEGFIPTSAEVLVLYNLATVRSDPRGWDPISAMSNGDGTYTGQTSTVGTESSYNVWQHHPLGQLYDYAIKVQSVDGETVGANSPFTVEYNGIAQHQASGGYETQTQLLTAILKPRTYSITYYQDYGQFKATGNTSELTGMSVTTHTWSHETKLPVPPSRGAGYTFVGWVDASGNNITSISADTAKDTVLYAKWTYTVTWMDQDGDVLETDMVTYGTTPTYDNTSGTMEELAAEENTAQYSYTFDSWTPIVGPVSGPMVYTARYGKTVNKYSVRWVNWNGSELEVDPTVPYGSHPVYDGAPPTRAADARYSYIHSGWLCSVDGHTHSLAEMASVTVTGDVTFTAAYTEDPQTYTIYWVDEGGTVLETDENVPYGATPTYDGSTPTKPADEQYTYTFAGWSPVISPVTGTTAYFAAYSSTVNTYTVKWVHENGTVLETDTGVEYGEIPEYNGETPAKAADERFTYTHSGWSPVVEPVTGDVTYTAAFLNTRKTYTVTWKDWDNTVLEVDENMFYGATPIYHGAPPVRTDNTGRYTYTFTGWSPAPSTVTGNVTYTATYSSAENTYTVTWKNWDGTVLEVDENVAYGTDPHYGGEAPTRPQTGVHEFEWHGWVDETGNTTLSPVTGNVTYTAVFVDDHVHYTVTWVNHDGTVLGTDTLPYGIMPAYSGETPVKAADAQYTYAFIGWSPAVESVTGDAEYTALFSPTVNRYTVTWKNHDGTVLATDTLPYGALPVYGGEAPVKTGDAQNTYTFIGWTPAVERVTGDAEYTACFTEGTVRYTVTYTDGVSGTGAFADQVYDGLTYGAATPAFSGTPSRSGYTFIGWSPAVASTVTESVTYTAQWRILFPMDETGSLILTKVDAADHSTVLAGVIFDLFQSDGTKVGSYTTDSNGQIHVTDLEPGDYYWVEKRPAAGYILDHTHHTVQVRAGWNRSLTVENRHSAVPEVFSGEHYAFALGSTDGLIHPERSITRAEVATIFFRLLEEDIRMENLTVENSFSDVNEGDWFNTAVSTMAALGVIGGYPDGTFRPNASITRAEFAALAAHFEEHGDTTDADFSDVYGHWAHKEINVAYNNGWILGYADGSFLPDQHIIRAEAMALVNRVLQRVPQSEADLLASMKLWPDNADTTQWYYLTIQEATNSHGYVRKLNGYEYWTQLIETPDWTKFER